MRPERIRRLGSVSPDTPLDDVLATMQRARAHLGGVDRDDAADDTSAAGPSGLVVLEDVLARLVGEVRDATPEAETGAPQGSTGA